MIKSANTMQKLNDEFRRKILLERQGAFITTGVAALGWDIVQRIVKTVATFDDFHHDSDPYTEHDLGSFTVDGQSILFKIDYYDKRLQSLSHDPLNTEITIRIITIMLAEEY